LEPALERVRVRHVARDPLKPDKAAAAQHTIVNARATSVAIAPPEPGQAWAAPRAMTGTFGWTNGIRNDSSTPRRAELADLPRKEGRHKFGLKSDSCIRTTRATWPLPKNVGGNDVGIGVEWVEAVIDRSAYIAIPNFAEATVDPAIAALGDAGGLLRAAA
jgi:hypothetical protein